MNPRWPPLIPILAAAAIGLDLALGIPFTARSAEFEFGVPETVVTVRHGRMVDRHRVGIARWRSGDRIGIPLVVTSPWRWIEIVGDRESVVTLAPGLPLDSRDDGEGRAVVSGSLSERDAIDEVVIGEVLFPGLERMVVRSYRWGLEQFGVWIVPRGEITPTSGDPTRRRLLHWSGVFFSILAGIQLLVGRRWIELIPVIPALALTVPPLLTEYGLTLPWRTFALFEIVALFAIAFGRGPRPQTAG